MRWSLAQIAEETGLSLKTVRRVWVTLRPTLSEHYRTAPGGRLELDTTAREKLEAKLKASTRTPQGRPGGSSSATASQDIVESLRGDNRRLFDMVESLQKQLNDQRHRTDTILMTALKEIRLALPAPPQEVEKQESQSSPGPFAVLKSVWRDFVGWLDSPYPQKA